MAIEQEIKLLLPSDVNTSSLVPASAKSQQVTQVYLSPNQSKIGIKKIGDTAEITLTTLADNQAETLSLTGSNNIEACDDLLGSNLDIVEGDGVIGFDGKDTEIRIRTKNEKAFLTLKKKTLSAEFRNEFEFEIPHNSALRLQESHIAEGTVKIEKTRNSWKVEDSTYELDVFSGENAGLVVLEIENPPVDFNPQSVLSDAKDVTRDKRYGNRQLAECPFSQWEKERFEGKIGGSSGTIKL